MGQIGFVTQRRRGYAAAEWSGSTSRFQDGFDTRPGSSATWEAARADANLHDARLVDAGDGNILEDPIVNFALTRFLDHHLLAAVDHGPKHRGLWLLCRIRAEREVNAGVREVGMT